MCEQLFFHKAVQNDTLFLSIVNVVDYSILVGFDENTHEIVVGIIDYMRQVPCEPCLCARYCLVVEGERIIFSVTLAAILGWDVNIS